MDDSDQNHGLHHLEDYYYDQIIRRRDISRRMNWRQRTKALSQREVATASIIHASSTFYLSLVFLLIYLINQVLLLLNHVQICGLINSSNQIIVSTAMGTSKSKEKRYILYNLL
jgi:hypothetical protein